ncbi:MAG: hypothetical protein NT062_21085, partial [Proteobacteria bacterium]|nr:hypothetical protein [Pseudomonadota bacterium]
MTSDDSPDLLDPALHASDAILAIFRDLAPVTWTPGRIGPGYWSITGHAELAAAARDPATFSSWWGTRPEVVRPEGAPRPLHNLDPPAHGARRAIARGTASAERFAALAPAIDQIVDDAFAALVDRAAPADAVRELAEPIASRVFAAWLARADPAELLALVAHVHAAGAALLDARAD